MSEPWMDLSNVSFNSLLLLERVQIGWFPGWVPEDSLAAALEANPVVAWYLRHKCPEISAWLDGVMARSEGATSPAEVRRAELAVIESLDDLLVYALNPGAYDAQRFLDWDSTELTSLVSFRDKVVLDIGAGTGRLTFVAAERGAAPVFAVEPVGNLRDYLRQKAIDRSLSNVYAVDGLITRIPFPDAFADVVMGGHVFGDAPESEYGELERVTKEGGMLILCPGNNDLDDDRHRFLLSRGFHWSRFEEPGSCIVRKYWKRKHV